MGSCVRKAPQKARGRTDGLLFCSFRAFAETLAIINSTSTDTIFRYFNTYNCFYPSQETPTGSYNRTMGIAHRQRTLRAAPCRGATKIAEHEILGWGTITNARLKDKIYIILFFLSYYPIPSDAIRIIDKSYSPT